MPLAGRILPAAALAIAAAAPLGCTADAPLNPSFPLLTEQARADLRRMREDPVAPRRPVVVIGGMYDVGIFAADLARRLRGTLHPAAEIIVIDLFATHSLDHASDRVVRTVDAALPSDDPEQTAEVDVVAFSLGGVVARHAAAERGDNGRRLNIARLFTIASPHQGARLACLPSLDDRVWALRPGSEFLTELAAAGDGAGYEAYAYARLGDLVVGEGHAGLPGEPPLWVPSPPLSLAHVFAYTDPRILADIARRLRGEPAHTVPPPAPLPERPYSSQNRPEPVLTGS